MTIDKNHDTNETDQEKDLPEEEKTNEVISDVVEPALEHNTQENNSIYHKVKDFLSLAIAIVALIFVVTAYMKIDKNMVKLESTIDTLETETHSFKVTLDEKLGTVDQEIGDIKSKVEKSQRIAAIMELKRALVTVQEVSREENSLDMQKKSSELIANIESFLQDLGDEKKIAPVGTVEVIEEPVNVSKETN